MAGKNGGKKMAGTGTFSRRDIFLGGEMELSRPTNYNQEHPCDDSNRSLWKKMEEDIAKTIEARYNCSLLFLWKDGAKPVCKRKVAEKATETYKNYFGNNTRQ